MRFVIVGVGAVGGVLGSHLSQGWEEVVLVEQKEHIETIRKNGLHLKGRFGDVVVHPPVARHINEVTPRDDDVICQAVKQYDTAAAVGQIREVYKAETPFLCFQNTMANEEIVSKYFTNVYGVAIRMGAKFVTPGEVHHLGANTLTMGRYPSGTDATIEEIASHVRKGGFEVHVHPNIMGVKWYKLFINLGNSVHSIFGLSSDESPHNPECRQIQADLLEESLNVIKAAGIIPENIHGEPTIEEMITRNRRHDPPTRPIPANPEDRAYPSMWQDIYWKRGTTEARELNGRISALGKRVGLPTPINDLLTKLVDDMAEKREAPGKYTIAQFKEMLKG
ncbi:MAG: 2-dehydropantoate 2-reductase [Candidatus Tectomicrobia bacterium]|nr:2-dehydropantoate 2-reductase [Candidatus Tectomicrobia bacterium]